MCWTAINEILTHWYYRISSQTQMQLYEPLAIVNINKRLLGSNFWKQWKTAVDKTDKTKLNTSLVSMYRPRLCDTARMVSQQGTSEQKHVRKQWLHSPGWRYNATPAGRHRAIPREIWRKPTSWEPDRLLSCCHVNRSCSRRCRCHTDTRLPEACELNKRIDDIIWIAQHITANYRSFTLVTFTLSAIVNSRSRRIKQTCKQAFNGYLIAATAACAQTSYALLYFSMHLTQTLQVTRLLWKRFPYRKCGLRL